MPPYSNGGKNSTILLVRKVRVVGIVANRISILTLEHQRVSDRLWVEVVRNALPLK